MKICMIFVPLFFIKGAVCVHGVADAPDPEIHVELMSFVSSAHTTDDNVCEKYLHFWAVRKVLAEFT